MIIFDRVRVATATTGTGTITMGAAASNAMLTAAEAGAQDGDRTIGILEEGLDFEIFIGTIGGSVSTITRDTVLASKIGGSPGTSKMNLSGNASLRFTIDASELGYARNQGFWRVRVVDVAGLDPSTAYEAGDTIDGETLAAGDIVLRAVPEESPDDRADNGPYQVQAAGGALRHPAFAEFNDIAGVMFRVLEGTTYANTLWECTSAAGGTLGSTALAITEFKTGAGDLLSTNNLSDLSDVPTARDNLGVRAGGAGEFFWHTADSPPPYALECDGSAVSRSTYSRLWTFVQSSGNLAASEGAKLDGEYGPGDGSTTFTLPDLVSSSRFIRAATTVGAEQSHQLQSHTHSIGFTAQNRAIDAGTSQPGVNYNTDATGTGTTGNFGSETRPVNIALLPCVVF